MRLAVVGLVVWLILVGLWMWWGVCCVFDDRHWHPIEGPDEPEHLERENQALEAKPEFRAQL